MGTELGDRERRLSNLGDAVGTWLEKDIQQNKDSLG
jgi:hypothetical protein